MVRAGVKNFPHSRAHIHFLTSKLYHFLIPLFAGDSGRETITLVHVMNFFISCKISQRVLERQKKLLARFPKFTQLLNKNLFITRTNRNEKFFLINFLLRLPPNFLSGGAVLKSCLQVGIISFGSTECGFSIPSVFTRIEDPAIRGFIRKLTGI